MIGLFDIPVQELQQLQRTAWQLHHRDEVPWAQVAIELEEPEAIVRAWAADYVARTDATRAATELALF